jgi:hypothetical protein
MLILLGYTLSSAECSHTLSVCTTVLLTVSLSQEAHEKTADRLHKLEQLSGGQLTAAEYEAQKSLRAKEALLSERDGMGRQLEISNKIRSDLEYEVSQSVRQRCVSSCYEVSWMSQGQFVVV